MPASRSSLWTNPGKAPGRYSRAAETPARLPAACASCRRRGRRPGPAAKPQRASVAAGHWLHAPHTEKHPSDCNVALETRRTPRRPAVRTSDSAAPAVRLAFELLVLTAKRSGEVRLARWDEIDLAGRVWTISAERMKAKREHRVPLSGRAVEVLEAARGLGDGELVFPMRSGRPTAASTLPKMLQLHGIPAAARDFRSSFRDWAAERTDHPREVIEAALAHVAGNKVEAAYAHSDLVERRRLLMEDWGAYLDAWCVFRTKWIADFGGSGSPVSVEVDHRFRRKWIAFGRSGSPGFGGERSSVA